MGLREYSDDFGVNGGVVCGADVRVSVSVRCIRNGGGGGDWRANVVGVRLMGQDEIYLQVIEQSGEGAERIHAKRVLGLLKRGKHWVLVTLLLSNVITNETLPIVLDRSLGGGWPAVVTSTVLIGMFSGRWPRFEGNV